MITAAAALIAAGGVAAVVHGRNRRPAPDRPTDPTGFRYCPAELRITAVTIHEDGTARCDGCGAPIPAGDS